MLALEAMSVEAERQLMRDVGRSKAGLGDLRIVRSSNIIGWEGGPWVKGTSKYFRVGFASSMKLRE